MATGGRNRGTLVAAAWALALLWPGSGPVQAAPPPDSYLLDKVTVLGGNPIEGVKDGVILRRLGCSPEEPLVNPLAASLGAGVRLDVEIRSCPGNAPPPTGECRLQVGQQPPVTFTVSGWKATFPVALPAETGIYPLSLRCIFSGQPEQTLDSDLFVTWKDPDDDLTPVPREDWYRLACTWGAGLKAADLSPAVLERILHGLYDKGQRYWRYGYCFRFGTVCIFGETTLPISSPDLVGRGPLRTCDWRLLAAGDPQCNFTDCFGFSDLFRYISGTMGIGVTALPPVLGSQWLGFSTQGWLKALDPAAGNLDCGYRGQRCAFLFGVHSVVYKDGVIYDPTFGQTYSDLGGLIAQNILSKARGVVTLDRSLACALIRPPYGGFMYFRELPPGVDKCPINENRPAIFLILGADLKAGAVELESVEGDERPELIRVRLDVEVKIAGSYQVYGTIVGGPDGEQVAVSRPSHLIQTVFSSSRISGLPGIYEVDLTFSGEDLVRSGVAQPYWIDATIVSEEGISNNIRRKLPQFSLEGLGEVAVRLKGIAGKELRRTGEGAVLRVSVSAEVRNAGSYAVAAYLSSGGRTAGETVSYRELPQGEQTLEVDFPGEGLDGPYTVTIEVHALDPETREPLGIVDVLRQEVDV